jgi:tRNA G18 (ribose-2'-O)-methylase SpoU
MPLVPIRSLDDPRLDIYRDLKRSNLTRWSGRFIAEGAKVVERLLASDFPVESVLVSERRVEQLFATVPVDVPVLVVPQELAEQLVGYNFHTGVLACGRRKPAPDLDVLLRDAASPVTLVACPNVDDPENLGAIIRLCRAFGVAALLLGGECADPFSRRVLRVSMGNAFRLPIVDSEDLRRDLEHLRAAWRVELTATALDQGAEELTGAGRAERIALLFGNEAHGLDREWIELCDRRITIPMHGGTDSLNVAVAAGIFLFHLAGRSGS